MQRLVFGLVLTLVALPLAAAPSATPSHPLSHIQPVDVDLNMSGQRIHNVSSIRIQDGFNFTDNAIQAGTHADLNYDTLRWNNSERTWEFRNSNISLNNNALQDFFGGQCAAGEAITKVYANGSYQCISFTDSTDDKYVNEAGDEMNGSLNMSQHAIRNVSQITNFFAEECAGDDVVTEVKEDGSYNCTSVSSLNTVEDLQETLQEGNSAGDNNINMSGQNITSIGEIYYDQGVIIGNRTTNTQDSSQIAIGRGAQAGGSAYSLAIGEFSQASGASSVAIGRNAKSPNNNEATFGNLNGNRMNVNVTANLTMHGRKLDLKNGKVQNFFSNACSEDNQAVKRIYANGSYVCERIPEDIKTENLSMTLTSGNIANQSIDMKGNDIDAKDKAKLDFDSGAWLGQRIKPDNSLEAGSTEIYSKNSAYITIDGPNSGDSWKQFVVKDGSDTELIKAANSGNVFVPSGNLSVSGDLEMNGNQLYGIKSINNYFENGASQSQTVSGINSSGYLQTTPILVDTSNIAEGAVANSKIGVSSVNSTQIINGAVNNNEIALNAVNRSQISQSGCTGDQVLKWNGSEWKCTDVSNFGTDDQVLTVYNNTNGDHDTINIEDGNNITVKDDVDDADSDPANELQNLSEVLVRGNQANQSINMTQDNIQRVNEIGFYNEGGDESTSDSKIIQDSGGNNLDIVTSGGYGTDNYIRIIDNQNSNQVIARFQEGGSVEIPNGDLDVSGQFSTGSTNCGTNEYIGGDGNCKTDNTGTDDQTLSEVLAQGNYADGTDIVMNGSANLQMENNNITEIGSGATNITSTGKIEAGDDIDVNDNNLNDVNSIDGNGDAVRVDSNLDMNGNSVTTSSGEVCIGDNCS